MSRSSHHVLLWCICAILGVCGCQGRSAKHGSAGVLHRDPLAAQRLIEQGLILIKDDRLVEARQCFEEALEHDPYSGAAHNNLGIVLLEQGEYYAAGWSFRYAIGLMPKVAAPRRNLALLFERVGQLDVAEEHLQQALQLSPDDVEIIGLLARVHVRQGKYTPETLAWLEAVTTQDDNPAWRNWAREQLTIADPVHTKKEEEP